MAKPDPVLASKLRDAKARWRDFPNAYFLTSLLTLSHPLWGAFNGFCKVDDMKPFKPPTFQRRPPPEPQTGDISFGPPAKKRRISQDTEDNDPEATAASAKILKHKAPFKSFQVPMRKPLDLVSSNSLPPSSPGQSTPEGYYTVLWYVSSISIFGQRSYILGVISRRRRTRHGTEMAY